MPRFSRIAPFLLLSCLMLTLTAQKISGQGTINPASPSDWPDPPDPFLTVTELYDSVEAGVYVDGSSVRVLGEYVHPEVSILVDAYFEYLDDQMMPVNSSMLLEGTLPDPIWNNGGSMIVTGSILIGVNPNLRDVNDTLLITIFPDNYEYHQPGWAGADSLTTIVHPWNQQGYRRNPSADDCDSCKFAILVSSMGTRGAHGGAAKPTYWENIVNLRRHKIDNEGYCEENIFVHFADGISDDDTQIPDSLVEPAKESSISNTHDIIARRIAECKRRGHDSKVQKMFTNHGSNDNGVVLWRADGDTIRDHRYLSPDELTEMQQRLIDSCCKILIDEFVTCYGGDMLNGLLDIDNLSKTQIHANSAAPDYAVGWSPRTGGHAYLNAKIACLADTTRNYEECVREAEEQYYVTLRAVRVARLARQQLLVDSIALFEYRLDSLLADSADGTIPGNFVNVKAWYQQWLAHLNWKLGKVQTHIAGLNRQIDGDADGNGQGCPSWVRHSYHNYCEWKEFVGEPGGQLTVDFTGPPGSSGVGCGNVTIWERMSDGTYRRVRQWNWNLPGGLGYLPGAERRVLHIPPTGTGVYFIHNDDGEYTIDVHSLSGRPDAVEDPSNDYLSAGFSIGATDGSPGEFGPHLADAYATVNTNLDGFNLADVPIAISAFEGVGEYRAGFVAEAPNPYWDDMEVVINVLGVSQPGTINVDCPAADITTTTVLISEPGEYHIPLGAIAVPTESFIGFSTSITGASFTWDAWSLRTLVPKYGDILCCGQYTGGFTGNVNCSVDGRRNLADITVLIDNVYISKADLCCGDSGNVDGDPDGKINLADITQLIDHVYISKGETAACE